MLSRLQSREVRVYVSNGSVSHFTLREMHQLYRTWQLWLLVIVGFFIMATGHPVTLPQFDSFELRLAFWVVGLGFYLAASEFHSFLIYSVWQPIFKRPIPLLLLSAPLVLYSTYLAGAVLTLISGTERPPFGIMTWQMNVRNIIVAHIFETVALLWLLPAQRARACSEADARKVMLGGRRFNLCDIQRIKAAEHYLEVHGTAGVETVRERMLTFLEQVEPGDGIQTHRSHWVAATSARDMKGGHLQLSDGEKVPVARGRQNDVRDWLRGQNEPA
ncbi:LytTR family DNA-binding domain-containing protein [uncultured Tateyamaria sp.]|uniref:LytTR family DNA-binding domain-containing protein n=1 Tax=uncultured Tateyamaria sp. TaxID=455651 RepID=UPI0026118E6E|nr:LytTR family DNA-binding domain-containing protein [uncultured Tateyamaria sp.]